MSRGTTETRYRPGLLQSSNPVHHSITPHPHGLFNNRVSQTHTPGWQSDGHHTITLAARLGRIGRNDSIGHMLMMPLGEPEDCHD